jgi:hypothetical protein
MFEAKEILFLIIFTPIKCYSVTFAARRDSVVITPLSTLAILLITVVVAKDVVVVMPTSPNTITRRKRKSVLVTTLPPLLPSAILLPPRASVSLPLPLLMSLTASTRRRLTTS